ncbi:hypothetical protein F5Y16DRAFT_398756 [Xylariaceae sp. FL0255]|nr:hypothetical protein F5Y16DRAFT_398756 [Xylariaceae sp. FL0255]
MSVFVFGAFAAPTATSKASPHSIAREYFTHHPNFELERTLGNGIGGIAFQFKENIQNKGLIRWAVKFALYESQVYNLEKEIRLLQTLRGALHIAQLRAANNDLRSPTTGPRTRQVALITELVKNLSLQDFVDRFLQQFRDQPAVIWPNRLLWYIFLCCASQAFHILPRSNVINIGATCSSCPVTRIACALAFPPNQRDDDTELSLEEPSTYQSNDQKARAIFHGDFGNWNNLIFGDTEQSQREHNIFPILKLIDFGEAKTDLKDISLPNPLAQVGTITQANLYEIGWLMKRLTDVYNEYDLIHLPNADQALYDLVARCTHNEAAQRPSLEELSNTIETKLGLEESDGQVSFVGNESDQELERIVRECVLTGSTT